MRGLALFSLIAAGFFSRINAQGIYREFGQNRVQCRSFQWEKLTFNNLDVIYYDKEDVPDHQVVVDTIEKIILNWK